MAAPKPIWVRQAEEAKLKSEAETAAAAKAAFDATFKALAAASGDDYNDVDPAPPSPAELTSTDSDDDAPALPGPVDPSKCSAAGPGIAGGSAGTPSTFTVVAKDRHSRRLTAGGARVHVRVSPAAGVGGDDLEGTVKDNGDGSYTVTYVVPKRGNYMVHVELDGVSVMGSPFPVFFSGSTATPSAAFPTALPAVSSAYPNMVNQTMPNMPNYTGAPSSAFPSLLGAMPSSTAGSSGGVILPGVGASLGEICRDYMNGRCTKVETDCKFTHPPQQLLMSLLAATTSVSALGHAPLAPSAAAMAAAQAIMAAQALQAHAAQAKAAGSTNKADEADALKRTVQISNLSPLLTVDYIKQLFGFCGKVVDCVMTDTKQIVYVEYSKPEEATAALELNSKSVGGRPLNVEMAKALPPKANNNLPMMMQQAVQLQQIQFQQALMMQQSIAAQQAAARAATMKSATEAAAARAAEISRKLKAEGFGGDNMEEKDAKGKSGSPSSPTRRSKSRSRSPIKYRRSRRSRSYSPPVGRSREHRSRSPSRSRHSKHGSDRSHRDDKDMYSRSGRRESERSRDHHSSRSRRNRSKSRSPRHKKPSRVDSRSPKKQRLESLSPSKSRSARAGSRSPRHHKGSKSSPTSDRHSRHSRHSRSRSLDRKHHHSDKKDSRKSEIQDDRRSHRGSRRDKDESSVKDDGERSHREAVEVTTMEGL
ncbi:RNA recognition motif (RRM)-containing protein [Zea mays]|uniref:RNA recognition motif (RRM)-containing protein n=1 Tax=Zea mays TaxID=4577 RepID=A0A1D6MP90_MAIZE|nr:RNA recognition motif (RRM)-containing protein [Zea mays]ONM30866.1 RNA recognition motif (RRM)-containing protein [Zea mays]